MILPMGKYEKAILIDVIDPSTSKEEAELRLLEMESLVNTFGGVVVVKTIQKKGIPEYDTYIGSGKVNEIYELAKEHEADVLIINNLLKPRQLFHLNEKFKDIELVAWDRVDLILKIFSKHAQTTEAKLQIELASIRHMGPRIFDMGMELSRQAGATGVRAGQGESNTEMMKRHLRKQELSILKKLKHYETIHSGHRKRRRRQDLKTAAIVGYTNAGKSSLLNALTQKGVYAADELFATLDTRIGKLYIHPTASTEGYQPGQELLISDTIGFIQDLPPNLIQAFKSTLAETVDSDLLLHVIDINDPQIHHKIQVVEDIIEQLGISDKPRLYIFNKLDLIAHSNIFDEPKQKTREYSLLKAGPETTDMLGWTDSAIRNEEARKHMSNLSKRYKSFSPIFISANARINLETLIENLSSNI